MPEQTPAYRVPVDAPSIGDGSANVAQPATEGIVTVGIQCIDELVASVLEARWTAKGHVISDGGTNLFSVVNYLSGVRTSEHFELGRRIAAHLAGQHNAWLDAQSADAPTPSGIEWRDRPDGSVWAYQGKRFVGHAYEMGGEWSAAVIKLPSKEAALAATERALNVAPAEPAPMAGLTWALRGDTWYALDALGCIYATVVHDTAVYSAIWQYGDTDEPDWDFLDFDAAKRAVERRWAEAQP